MNKVQFFHNSEYETTVTVVIEGESFIPLATGCVSTVQANYLRYNSHVLDDSVLTPEQRFKIRTAARATDVRHARRFRLNLNQWGFDDPTHEPSPFEDEVIGLWRELTKDPSAPEYNIPWSEGWSEVPVVCQRALFPMDFGYDAGTFSVVSHRQTLMVKRSPQRYVFFSLFVNGVPTQCLTVDTSGDVTVIHRYWLEHNWIVTNNAVKPRNPPHIDLEYVDKLKYSKYVSGEKNVPLRLTQDSEWNTRLMYQVIDHQHPIITALLTRGK